MNNERSACLQAEMVIDADSKPLTGELVAYAFFGMSLTDLLREMKENRGGRFDCIYSEEFVEAS